MKMSPHAEKLNKVKQHHNDAAHDMVPVRISIDEIMYLNYMQGGQFIDKDTGLREYSRLLNIVKNPEIRDIFIQLYDATKQPKGLPKELNKLVDQIEQAADIHQYYGEIPSDIDPEIQKIEQYGEGADKKLVMMPKQLVGFLDVVKGSTETDPTMGLQEFGRFLGIKMPNFVTEGLRAIATIGGAVVGGPLGAAAGNFTGKVLTGANPRDNIIPAAKVGLATWGAGKLAGAAGSAFPGLASAAPGVFGANPGWAALPTWASSMMPGMGGVTPAGAIGPGSAATTAAASGAAQAASSNPSTWSSALSSAGSWLGPAAMIGGGLYMSNRSEQQKVKAMQKIAEQDNKRAEELRKRYGFDEPLGVELRHFPNSASEVGALGKKAHYERMANIQGFKAGGHLGRPIVGKGKGQEDLIKDDRVKEGGWIWDATTTAHFGDGSTKAGQNELSKLEKFIAKNAGNLKKYQKLDHGGSPQKVPCALSDGERYTPPEVVTAAGHGSNEQGAARFRTMTKELRKHKIAHGTELPPPAPDVIKMFKKVG